MGPAGVYQMFGQGGRTFGGLYSVPGARPHWLVYLRVPDVHAAVAAVRANGGTVNREPMEVPGGNVVVDAQDPWGAAFGLDQKPAS